MGNRHTTCTIAMCGASEPNLNKRVLAARPYLYSLHLITPIEGVNDFTAGVQVHLFP